MVRPAYFDKYGMKKGLWDEYEDYKLKACITQLGHVVPNWRLLPIAAGLKRCGKSCRLRWMNYLKPGLNKGKFSKLEEDLIIKLHKELGNKWSAIAANFPGRTDNDIKNYWNAHIKKRKGGVDREIRAQSLGKNNLRAQSLGKNNLRNDQDQQSSDDKSSCISLSAENMESNADSDNNGYEILDVDLPPLIPEEELNGFGLWQNDMVSDYSDAARFLEEDLVMIEGVGEECFSMGLW